MFQAYWENNPICKDSITSFEKWKEVLEKICRGNGHIEDEYGAEVRFDTFVRLVNETREPWGAKQIVPQNHTEYMKKSQDQFGYDKNTFNDPEGWSFSYGEFS